METEQHGAVDVLDQRYGRVKSCKISSSWKSSTPDSIKLIGSNQGSIALACYVHTQSVSNHIPSVRDD